MKLERGNGGVTRGMMGKNLVAQGTQFDSERGRPFDRVDLRLANWLSCG